MTASEQLVQRNQQRTRPAPPQPLAGKPTLPVAVVTCMDCRINLFQALGLQPGEVHILRNAGGAVTDDVIRSLAISQRKLGTTEVMVMHHTKCGMTSFSEADFKDGLERDTGVRPGWAVETFADIEADLRQSLDRLHQSPFLTETVSARAFIHDVDTDALTEVHT